jgi:hypothetical protein
MTIGVHPTNRCPLHSTKRCACQMHSLLSCSTMHAKRKAGLAGELDALHLLPESSILCCGCMPSQI